MAYRPRSAIRQQAAEDLHLDPHTPWSGVWGKIEENERIGCLATAEIKARLVDELDAARPAF